MQVKKIEPANEEDEDGLMNEEIIENEAKDKRLMYGICKATWLEGYNIELKALNLAFHSKGPLQLFKNGSLGSQIDLMCLQLPLTLTVKNIINVAIASYPGRRLEGDWTTDVLTDATTRVEESVKRNSYSQPSIT
ncbi:hypothetical protein D5086_002176 [Populus alba]|uniref:Uncharacterized protein n=1 Tax=Populus alba TaxID=43335 RepID=A0ACC4D0V2_POPAL